MFYFFMFQKIKKLQSTTTEPFHPATFAIKLIPFSIINSLPNHALLTPFWDTCCYLCRRTIWKKMRMKSGEFCPYVPLFPRRFQLSNFTHRQKNIRDDWKPGSYANTWGLCLKSRRVYCERVWPGNRTVGGCMLIYNIAGDV